MPRKCSIFFGTIQPLCQRGYSFIIPTLLLALALLKTVLCRNNSPLMPVIIHKTDLPWKESTKITLGCKLLYIRNDLNDDYFPMWFSRQGGFPPDKSITTKRETEHIGMAYYLNITFTVTASDNRKKIECKAFTPYSRGEVAFHPLVVLLPSQPQISGPVRVVGGEEQNWMCTSQGGSLVAPTFTWSGDHRWGPYRRVKQTVDYEVDTYRNKKFSVSSVLTTALPRYEYQMQRVKLTCALTHKYWAYERKANTSLTVEVWPCPFGKYGEGCTGCCSQRCTGDCDPKTGACISGCEPGYQGGMCDIACEKGRYGPNCRMKCSPECNGTACDPWSGACTDGRVPMPEEYRTRYHLGSASGSSAYVVAFLLLVIFVLSVALGALILSWPTFKEAKFTKGERKDGDTASKV